MTALLEFLDISHACSVLVHFGTCNLKSQNSICVLGLHGFEMATRECNYLCVHKLSHIYSYLLIISRIYTICGKILVGKILVNRLTLTNRYWQIS